MSKVLFIDDDQMILRMASFIAKKCGVPAECCSSAAEGLSSIETDAPALAFIDVEMPETNGIELLEMLSSKGITDAVKIYMMSGTVTDEVCQKATVLGAKGVIGKPLNAGEVSALIKGALA